MRWLLESKTKTSPSWGGGNLFLFQLKQTFFVSGDLLYFVFVDVIKCEIFGYIKLKNNALLKRKFEELLTDKIIRNRESGWSSFSYQAKSWKHPRRVLGRIQWSEGQLFPVCSAIVTNDEACTSEDGFQFYNGRAGIEDSLRKGKIVFLGIIWVTNLLKQRTQNFNYFF